VVRKNSDRRLGNLPFQAIFVMQPPNTFIGAGPWFHGSHEFLGNVNNRLHPEHGYKGLAPKRGEKAETVQAYR
jgi:hypothetical protein